MKKVLIFLITALSLLSSAGAANVTVDGERFDGARLVGSVTYVPIRDFCKNISDYEVVWENKTRVATVVMDESKASAGIGKRFIESSGRYIYSGNENMIIDGSTYVPIRSISNILGAKVEWDAKTRTARVTSDAEKFVAADEFYNEEDLFWLSRIISAESAGESLEGKIAVGNVVLNRVMNEEYPNSIREVIFDEENGVQFTPVANGTIYNTPTGESVMAAKICLENYKLSNHNILFFLNPEISTSTWVPDNRKFIMTIGRHDFYA